MAREAVIPKCGKKCFLEKYKKFPQGGLFVFWAWGWKISSQNIRKFFWKNIRNFLGLGLESFIPKYNKKFL